MEEATLSPGYWEDETPDLRLNPAVPSPPPGLEEVMTYEPRLKGHLLFATSGSSGLPKIVCLSKAAFLTAARWTNLHLGCDANDCWLVALPLFHVGGLGVVARAEVAKGRLEKFSGRWDGENFVSQAASLAVTVTSLVPTQLHDLVTRDLRPPKSLRMVVIGGGRLDPGLRERALALGWPVRESYGMTETCAQVATQLSSRDPAGWLPVIPEWRVRVDDGQLWLRGAPLLTAYLEYCEKGRAWRWHAPCNAEGWFATGDVGEVDGEGRIRVQGRARRMVKILGELVDLDRLDLVLAGFCPEGDAVLEPVEDARAGWKLLLISEREQGEAEALAERFNASVAPFEHVTEVRVVARLRRSPLGKRLSQLVPDSSA